MMISQDYDSFKINKQVFSLKSWGDVLDQSSYCHKDASIQTEQLTCKNSNVDPERVMPWDPGVEKRKFTNRRLSFTLSQNSIYIIQLTETVLSNSQFHTKLRLV